MLASRCLLGDNVMSRSVLTVSLKSLTVSGIILATLLAIPPKKLPAFLAAPSILLAKPPKNPCFWGSSGADCLCHQSPSSWFWFHQSMLLSRQGTLISRPRVAFQIRLIGTVLLAGTTPRSQAFQEVRLGRRGHSAGWGKGRT